MRATNGYCSSLTSVTIPNSVTTIGDYAFSNCRGLTTLTIGSGVTTIGEAAFEDCSGLTTLTIPNSVTKIGDSAFRGCSGLTSVTIGNSVTSIGGRAFEGCSSLTNCKIFKGRPLQSADLFKNCNLQNATLYVPTGSYMLYAKAPEWIKFGNIVEFSDGEDVHYITIKQGEGGSVRQSVDLGKTYQYLLEAETGWEIHSVSFNGADVTSQLYNGQYSTPLITDNSELVVVFQKKDDAVRSIAQDAKVKVLAYGNRIAISGAQASEDVSVYDVKGSLIKSAKGNAHFTLDSKGVYIVKIGAVTYKVTL